MSDYDRSRTAGAEWPGDAGVQVDVASEELRKAVAQVQHCQVAMKGSIERMPLNYARETKMRFARVLNALNEAQGLLQAASTGLGELQEIARVQGHRT